MAKGEDAPSYLVDESGKVPALGNHQMDRVWEEIRAARAGATIPAPLNETVRVKPVENPTPPEVQTPLF